MSPGRPRSVAPWLALCLALPLVAGTAPAPGSFQSESSETCAEIPCLLWRGVHEGPEGKAMAHHVTLSPDGHTAYVVGATSTVTSFTDLVTWALDVDTGDLLWSSVYDGGSDEDEIWYYDVRAIAISPDGSRVTVAGTSQGGFGMGHDIVTLAYDATTGQELWVHRYDGGPDSDEDIATAIAVDRTGSVVVTAGSVIHDNGRWSGILLGHDLATGASLWELPFASPCWSSDILGLKPSPTSGAVYVGGVRSTCLSDHAPTPQDTDLAFTPTIWAVDPHTGNVLWEAQDDDVLLTGQTAYFLGALETTQEGVVLSSRISNPRNPGTPLSENVDLDILTLAVDHQGELQWRARIDSMGRDDLLGMRADPDGSHVYVVAASPALGGAGEADQNRDIVVTTYNREGDVAWSTRLDSSTTGVPLEGVMLAGEGDDDGFISAPALFDGGTRLAIGYVAWLASPIPVLGPSGPNAHVLVVLDTSNGSVQALRTDEADLEEYTYAAKHDRADLVGVGSINGQGFDSMATFRRLSLDVTPPVLSLPEAIVREATGAAGAVVSYAATATDDRDGDVLVACNPASGSLFPLAATVVTCSALDSYNNAATGSFEIRVQDTTAPVLDVPEDVAVAATSRAGAVVRYNAAAQDLVNGNVPASCSHASGDIFPPGRTQVTCSATDAAGNQASAAFDVQVRYEWTGFQEPLQADGVSTFQHGRTVPVKVDLTGESAPVQDANFRLWIQTGGVEVPAVGRGTTSNALSYDEETGVYVFQWNTGTVLTGTHQLRLDLGDGTLNVVTVRLT